MVEKDTLGELEFQVQRAQAGCTQHVFDPGHDVGARHLQPGDVDRQALRCDLLQLPRAELLTGGAHHELADLRNQTAALGESDEFARRHHAAARMAPAHQCLHAVNMPAHQVHLRLVGDREFVVGQGAAQIALHVGLVSRGAVHGGVEEHVTPASSLLGAEHGRVGIAQYPVHALRVVGENADADAAANMVLVGTHRERPGQRLQQLVGDPPRVHALGDARQHDDEFVATKPGHHILLAHTSAHAAGGLGQHQVGAVVAERGVDLLEAVQIDKQQRQPAAVAPCLAYLLCQVLLQKLAVWQRCGGVEMGVVVEGLGACGRGQRGAEAPGQRTRVAGLVAANLVCLRKPERNDADRIAVLVQGQQQGRARPAQCLRRKQLELVDPVRPGSVRWQGQQLVHRWPGLPVLRVNLLCPLWHHHHADGTLDVAVQHGQQENVAAGALQQVAGRQRHQLVGMQP